MSARWPDCIEAYLAAGDAGSSCWRDSIIGRYERAFVIPAEWGHTAVQLTFGACGYETRAWLNGHPLRTVNGEEVHRGGYISFGYELPLQSGLSRLSATGCAPAWLCAANWKRAGWMSISLFAFRILVSIKCGWLVQCPIPAA
jgi:hypothetical protein